MRDEIAKTIGYWLELGVSGFRVDAVPFLIEPPDGVDIGDPHEFLRDIRRFLQRRSSEAVLLGEVNLPYDQQLEFFGRTGDPPELTMQFDFLGMQALYLSLAREDARPLAESLAKRPVLEPESQWANFVRNHDELTLDKLSESERQEVFDAFAPEEWMRVYGRGIVRRLPPMLDGDPRRIRMVYSLLFSLPGTPVLFYGEEIGMGENPAQEGRQAVRTPMQWTDEPNGGFSRRAARKLVATPPSDGYAPEHVNVEAQMHDPDSLLNDHPQLRGALPQLARDRLGSRSTCCRPASDAVLAHQLTRRRRALRRGAQLRGDAHRRDARARRGARGHRALRPVRRRRVRPRRAGPHRRAPRRLRVPLVPHRRSRRPPADLSDRERMPGRRVARRRHAAAGSAGARLALLAHALADDGRDAVLAHRDAVERVGDLHRALLVRDDDELARLAQVLEVVSRRPRFASSSAASTSSMM